MSDVIPDLRPNISPDVQNRLNYLGEQIMAIRCRHLPTRTAVSEDNPLLKDTCQYGDRPTMLNSQRAYMCSYLYHMYPITLRMKIVPNGLKESPCNTYV